MGTLFRITLHAEDTPRAREAMAAAFARAHQLDAIFSDYRPESELNRLCRAGSARVSPDLFAILERSSEVSRKSHGDFDVTVGVLVQLWRESRKSGRLPSEAERREAMKKTGWKKIHLNRSTRTVRLAADGMRLDLGGIAKGYAADEMMRILRGWGFPSALIAASGDLLIGKPPPDAAGWSVSVGNDVQVLSNIAVSTSGDSEQFFLIDGVRYSHIVDPRTGLPLNQFKLNQSMVTVLAPEGWQADAWATALSVLGKRPKSLKNLSVSFHPKLE